jgi:hypothetical protein
MARAENCSHALEYGSMKIVELVVVVGSIKYGWTLIGARAIVPEGSLDALGASVRAVSPKTVQSTSPINFSAR